MKHKNSIHRRVSMHRHHCETRYRDSDRQNSMLSALNLEGIFPLSDADWQKIRFGADAVVFTDMFEQVCV